MQNHRINPNTNVQIELINQKLVYLSVNPGYITAQDLIIEIVRLLGITAPERGKFGFILDQKFIKNEKWFNWHEIFPDKRAGEILKHTDSIPLDIKIYWLNKIASGRVKGLVRFTDNFEDNKRTRDDKKLCVGIDFLIHPKADGISIAISNNGLVRILELSGKLNNTQKTILSAWSQIGESSNLLDRTFLHESLWKSMELKEVNQKFYDMISIAFTNLRQHLEDKQIFEPEDSKHFANRLLGRLLFIWFLRKKDFIFEDTIPYFKTDDLNDETYYHTRLERLFFETLNRPMELRDPVKDDQKTPYLNGGLFYKQSGDKPKRDLSFPPRYFANLYNDLNEYNFTTDESTPDYEQVAIDPEMLGRVFENLLASMSVETGEQARKAKGAFYTPRPIVQYICQESIRRYLYAHIGEKEYGADIDNLIDTPDYEWANNESNKVRDVSKHNDFDQKVLGAIKDLKSIDPACGSGAFPIGMLQALLRIYTRLNRNINEYQFKLKILSENIYGIDIEPMAVEISRLRAFLALVVDQEYNSKNGNGGIDTLPNLEFKFVCANSLQKLGKSHSLFDGLDEVNDSRFDLVSEIFTMHKEYYKADWQKRQKLNDAFDKKFKRIGEIESAKYTQLRTFHPIHQIESASFYDPALMHAVSDGFDIVIGNPPYVSTKGVNEATKKLLETDFGFADDLYTHFYFKGLELVKDGGILSYITSKTFWTIQTKRNLRDLLLKNNLEIIYDTANPFESAMVDTCVILVQKKETKDNKISFLSGIDYLNPTKLIVDKSTYIEAVNQVIFNPTPANLAIYHQYNSVVKDLMKNWWTLINTSKNITKYAYRLNEYRQGLKPGYVTLLGLVTDGGQGLATANNGKYVGVLTGTKEALKLEVARKKRYHEITGKELNTSNEQEIRKIFEEYKSKNGRDVFGQGFLYQIVDPSEVTDVAKMTEEEKKNGLTGTRIFVPYDKGDKDGNRWYLRTPYYISWSVENVTFFKNNSGKKGKGMPVIRNPQFYFHPGFCWTDVNSTYLKARLNNQSAFDVLSMSMFSLSPLISDKFAVCMINSKLISEYVSDFINSTSHFQINDARQIPIIIPSKEQLVGFEDIFDRAHAIKVQQFEGKITRDLADKQLADIQKELDEKVYSLYKVKNSNI